MPPEFSYLWHVGNDVAGAAYYAFGQQPAQIPVNRRAGLPQGHRQFHCVHERHPAQGMEKLPVVDTRVSSVADGRPSGQQARVTVHVGNRTGDRSPGPNL